MENKKTKKELLDNFKLYLTLLTAFISPLDEYSNLVIEEYKSKLILQIIEILKNDR